MAVSQRGAEKVGNLEANIVIIGGGGAGLAAAVSAAEKRATGIIVLEKRGLGGNSAMAFNLFAADSPVQKRLNIDCSRDACYKLAMNFAHWRINPRIIRALIDKSGETIQWLEGKGLEFFCAPAQHPDHLPTPHRLKGGGAVLIKALIQDCKDMGVQLVTHTPAKKILTSTKGEVTGVLAETKGKRFTIATKSAIIATGGFGGNKRLLKKYCPYYHDDMVCDGIGHAGDGLVMATQIGAATEGLGTLNSSAPCAPNTVFVTVGTPPDQVRIGLKGLGGEPYSIWVNKRGVRFTDECVTFYHYEVANVFAQQPDKVSYSIYDSKMMQTMIDEGRGLMMGMPGMGAPQEVSGNKIKMPELIKALQQPVNNKVWVKVSDSWDEIARWIGTAPEVLKATIDEYNTACDQGHDPVFAKDRQYLLPLRTPPYFAVEGHITYVNTIGGIKINEYFQVLDKQDNPIPGLYAAGVDTGGWESETYCSRMSGHAFGFSINSGRLAGESAARFVSGNK
jgi:fumarate reductase flavoprotein subunit